jgi:Domain of unknown function (DUF4166)
VTTRGRGRIPEHNVATALYPRLVGDAWAELDASVQHWHDATPQVQGTGLFTVRHGQGRLAHFLVRLLRLPASGEALATRLVILRHPWGETWSRTFAGKALTTVQYQRGADLLAERLGCLEFRFRLRVIEQALDFWHTGTAGVLGPLRVPLPRWMSPRIAAREWAGLEEGSLQVAVRISLPFTGLLMAYEGCLKREDLKQ